MSIWTSLLTRDPAAVVAAHSMLVLVVAICAAAFVLGVTPGWLEVLGGTAILAGVAFTSPRNAADQQTRLGKR